MGKKSKKNGNAKGKRNASAAAEDDALFQEPTREECPLCLLPMPLFPAHTQYQPCCGTVICLGCLYSVCHARTTEGNPCPFCRTDCVKKFSESHERMQKRLEANNDGDAFAAQATYIFFGTMDMPKDEEKGMELYFRAAELGHGGAQSFLGFSHEAGEHGVKRDAKKAIEYHKLAAMSGNVESRHRLGINEGGRAYETFAARTGKLNMGIDRGAPGVKFEGRGDMKRAMKHFIISASAGYDGSLAVLKEGFAEGHVTKKEYEKTLRAYQMSCSELNSEQRDKGLAATASGWVVVEDEEDLSDTDDDMPTKLAKIDISKDPSSG